MRFFVEVSSIGDSGSPTRLCLEAKQWQSALEDAREWLGDRAPLSTFSIEVTDEGYRAVNSELRVRYAVRRAPDHAPLTDRDSVSTSSFRSETVAAGDARGALTLPAPPADPSLAPAVTVPDDAVPPAPPPVSQASTESTPTRVPSAPVTVAELAPETALAATLPHSKLLRERTEEPTGENTIVYREVAYAVEPGLARDAVERTLRARFQELCAELEARPAGKYVELAIFDQPFEGSPERPPIATLTWKDWRGGPIVAFPGFGEPPRPPSSTMPPRADWQKDAREADSSPPLLPPSSKEDRDTSQAGAELPKAPPLPTIQPSSSAAPRGRDSAGSETPAAEEADATPATLRSEPPPTVHARGEAFGAVETGSSPLVRSRPQPDLPGPRRRIGEDLIAELFERMHALFFMADIAEGSDYVLSLLSSVLPSEGIVIHVFDIDSSAFVVVRCQPHRREALLFRTPDDDPFVRHLMRQLTSVRYEDAAAEEGFRDGIWSLLAIEPRYALCGPVKHGGRYLGLIQLVNPSGGTPYHQSEANALDYICKQFADFVASKPVVLERDTVIPPA
jgi:hypothetical protein